MAFPPKKLKAFVKDQKKREDHSPGDDHDEDAEHEDDDEDKTNPGKGGGDGGKMAAMVEKAAKRVDAGGDEELMDLVDGYDPEADGNPPSWAVDEAKWEKAKKAVEKEGGDYDDKWAVVAHVYQSMGGKTK